MGQYYLIANLTKGQYLDPGLWGGGGVKLSSVLYSGGLTVSTGLALLILREPSKRFGDNFDPILGSWAGDQLVLAGDYAPAVPPNQCNVYDVSCQKFQEISHLLNLAMFKDRSMRKILSRHIQPLSEHTQSKYLKQYSDWIVDSSSDLEDLDHTCFDLKDSCYLVNLDQNQMIATTFWNGFHLDGLCFGKGMTGMTGLLAMLLEHSHPNQIFRNRDPLFGSWARNRITLTNGSTIDEFEEISQELLYALARVRYFNPHMRQMLDYRRVRQPTLKQFWGYCLPLSKELERIVFEIDSPYR